MLIACALKTMLSFGKGLKSRLLTKTLYPRRAQARCGHVSLLLARPHGVCMGAVISATPRRSGLWGQMFRPLRARHFFKGRWLIGRTSDLKAPTYKRRTTSLELKTSLWRTNGLPPDLQAQLSTACATAK